MSELQKTRLLRIAKAGSYAQMSPKELDDLHKDVRSFSTDSTKASEFFSLVELHFYVSLLTHRDVEAKASLDRIVDKFGHEKSQRVKLLRSLYLEAIGDVERASDILSGNPDEMELSRRLTTYSRKYDTEDNNGYINTLNFYIDLNPSDIKTWSELASEYAKSGNYDKSIYCYKEVLLIEPSAYNIFYQVGLMHYYKFLQLEKTGALKDKKDKLIEAIEDLTSARNNFLRSIEICGKYEKGWIGVNKIIDLDFNVKLADHKFASTTKEIKKYLDDNEKLRSIAKKNLQDI